MLLGTMTSSCRTMTSSCRGAACQGHALRNGHTTSSSVGELQMLCIMHVVHKKAACGQDLAVTQSETWEGLGMRECRRAGCAVCQQRGLAPG